MWMMWKNVKIESVYLKAVFAKIEITGKIWKKRKEDNCKENNMQHYLSNII